MQPWQRLFQRELGPQRVDDALAVQTGTRGEREELDQLGGLASVPGRPIDMHPVQVDGEPVEEPHIDVHRTMLVSRSDVGLRFDILSYTAGSRSTRSHESS